MNRREFQLFSVAAASGLLLPRVARAQTGWITEEYLAGQASVIDFGGEAGALLIAVVEADGSVVYTSLGEHPDGASPAPEDIYRVGSNTKTFTSTLVLTMVDEGLVELDSPASNYLTSLELPPTITVRQLLNHTSGLANYMETEAYYTAITEDPAHAWTPAEMIALVADVEPVEPGTAFYYANTNYVYLGQLIEDVTGAAYHEALQERIIEPLELDATYLAGFEEGPDPVGAWTYGIDSYVPMTMDYTAAATSTWSAGALVSTVADLHTFSTALHGGDLISEEMLTEMRTSGDWGYGLGLMPLGDLGQVWGHLGTMPGYLTLLAHSADTGRTAFFASTNDAVDPAAASYEITAKIGEP